jgi:hypothetical protein
VCPPDDPVRAFLGDAPALRGKLDGLRFGEPESAQPAALLGSRAPTLTTLAAWTATWSTTCPTPGCG